MHAGLSNKVPQLSSVPIALANQSIIKPMQHSLQARYSYTNKYLVLSTTFDFIDVIDYLDIAN